MYAAISVWSYVIPWECHVNSCHLRFSCSEFYADSKMLMSFLGGHLKVICRPLEVMTPRSHLFIYLFLKHMSSCVTHQNDRNCFGNIIKFEKN